MTEPQRRVLEELVAADGLYDNFWACYVGYRQVITSLFKRGWISRPAWHPEEGMVITEAGRAALQATGLPYRYS